MNMWQTRLPQPVLLGIMILILLLSYVVLITTACAQQPSSGLGYYGEPSQETKVWILKRAYELNGNSMVRWGSIDLEDLVDVEPANLPNKIPPTPIPPSKPLPPAKTVIEAEQRDVDTCSRHRMHKVYTDSGRSWRCRK